MYFQILNLVLFITIFDMLLCYQNLCISIGKIEFLVCVQSGVGKLGCEYWWWECLYCIRIFRFHWSVQDKSIVVVLYFCRPVFGYGEWMTQLDPQKFCFSKVKFEALNILGFYLSLMFVWVCVDLALFRFQKRMVNDPFKALVKWDIEEHDPYSRFEVECFDRKVVVL